MAWYDNLFGGDTGGGDVQTIDPTVATYAPDNSSVAPLDFGATTDTSSSIGGLDNLNIGDGSNYTSIQDTGTGNIIQDNNTGAYYYAVSGGETYPLSGYTPDSSSSILDTVGGALGSNLGGLLGRNTVGGALSTLAGAGLTNANNRQTYQQQLQAAKDWYNMQQAAEAAYMAKMGVDRHLTLGPVTPRQLVDTRGINFNSAGTRPGGLAFFTDVKKGY